MTNVNIVYDSVSGRILTAKVDPVSPLPSGHSVVVKDVAKLGDLLGKRIDPGPQALVDKNYLQLDSSATVPVSSVTTSVFTKRNGETNALMGGASDNETVQISARKTDYSFKAEDRQAFFDVLSTALVQGAGQVKVASGLAPGLEILVVHHDTLKPLFKTLQYA